MNTLTKINVESLPFHFPTKSYATDAAFNLYTAEDVDFEPHARKYISLGFKIQLPKDIGLIIQARSGQSGKGMIACAVAPKWFGGDIIKVRVDADAILGLVDYGYAKDVKAIVKFGRMKWKHRFLKLLGFKILIRTDSRICQGRFVNIPNVELVNSSVVGNRDGLGSTDK